MKPRNKPERPLTRQALKLLEMQGFSAESQERLRLIRPWLRIAPGITAAWLLLGTITQSALALWLVVPFSVLGAVLPMHPFDVFYNHCARYVLGMPTLPESPLQRRICCALASGFAAVTAILMQHGFIVAATVTGIVATTGCALPAVTEFCVPSVVMSLFGQKRAGCSTSELKDDRGRRTPPWWDGENPFARPPITNTVYVSAKAPGSQR